MEARRYKVVRKVRESETIASFFLEAADGRPLDPFNAGQFLTFEVPIAGRDKAEIREYSLSSSPHDLTHYRITVKREAPPADQPDLPEGVVSAHLHDGVEVGSILSAYPPRGHFVFEPESVRPVVLLSGGVGLTPTVSMLHDLAATGDRDACFIHACDNGRVHALADEVRAVVAGAPRIRLHFCYRFPEAGDAGQFDAEGLVSRELLQDLLPLDDYEFYLCGPEPFMKGVCKILRDLGVYNNRIRFEFFGPATLITEPDELEDSQRRPAETVVREIPVGETTAAPPPVAPTADGPLVTFSKSGIAAPWPETAETLLEFAESLGLHPEFSCRAGVCNSCQCGLAEGELQYIEEPLDDPEPGTVLICCSRPKTDVTLDM